MEKRVKDIMLPIDGYPSVQADSTVKEAVAILNRSVLRKLGPRIDSVLVIDNNKMVGTIGLRDILKAVEPAYKGGIFRGWSVDDDWASPIFIKGLFTVRSGALTEQLARKVMRPLQRLLNAEDTLVKALHVLLIDCQDAVPVWQNDRVVGMVGCADVFNEVAELQNGEQKDAGTQTRSAI